MVKDEGSFIDRDCFRVEATMYVENPATQLAMKLVIFRPNSDASSAAPAF